jgi:hypothetical protein
MSNSVLNGTTQFVIRKGKAVCCLLDNEQLIWAFDRKIYQNYYKKSLQRFTTLSNYNKMYYDTIRAVGAITVSNLLKLVAGDASHQVTSR